MSHKELPLQRVAFMGLFLDIVKASEVTNCILNVLDHSVGEKTIWVGNLNVHAVNIANDDSSVRDVFNKADLCFCDGRGLSLLLRAFGVGAFPQVTYNKWFSDFLNAMHEEGKNIDMKKISPN